MQSLDILKLSTRVFKTNKLRTMLTILGIGVGIGTILFLVSFGFGLQKVILEQIATSDSLLSLDVYSEASSLIELNKENKEKIENIPEIKKVSAMTSIPAQIEIENLSSGIIVNAVDVSFLELSGLQINEGKTFQQGESYKIIISSAALKAFNILDYKEAIGKIVYIKLYLASAKNQENENSAIEETKEVDLVNDYEIIGVIEDEANSYLYIPSESLQNFNLPNFSIIKIKIANKNEMESVRQKIIGMGFSVSVLSDTIEEMNKIFQVIQFVLSLFGAVALIVSAIGMFNTMTIALLERIQEIGIMKSLGASKSDIWKLFLVESVIIGFLGGISGILIGILGGKILNYGINKLASSMGGQEVNLFFTPQAFIIGVLVFATIVGFLTGLYPARRASKLNALDALRYK
jgi:putative ABC transport system permease protein